jgi:uncharacterized protein (DUF2235 family)
MEFGAWQLKALKTFFLQCGGTEYEWYEVEQDENRLQTGQAKMIAAIKQTWLSQNGTEATWTSQVMSNPALFNRLWRKTLGIAEVPAKKGEPEDRSNTMPPFLSASLFKK